MRLFLGTILFFLACTVNAQIIVRGNVTSNKTPLEGAAVSIISDGRTIASTVTNVRGVYELAAKQPGNYTFVVTHIGHKPFRELISLPSNGRTFNVELQENPLFLEPLEIRATRAGERAPFAKQTISKEEIAANNLGQDIPFLLNQVPSTVVNADAGNGIGYTGIRIRGTDASRINMTINGIPYNDAESQGIFFVNLPDLSSSASSIQVQRGVGTSSNGAGAFGATLNISTNEFNEKAYANLNNSAGSFNTWKHTLKAGTGLIGGHFTLDARLSKINSDGYVERASSDLRSFYLSGAYINKKSTLRLNIFSGNEKTYQSWYGIDAATLASNRRFNPAGTEKPGTPYDNQTDNYQQDHYQLFFNHRINTRWSFNTAFFLVNGRGYYEQYRSQNRYSSYGLPNVVIGTTTFSRTDLIRQLWLDNSYYGQVASVQYRKPGTEFTLGGGWNTYDGDHFGKIIWAERGGIPHNYEWYNLPAIKKDLNVYAKLQQRIANNFEAFVDLQYRTVDYSANGFRDNPKLMVDRTFNFFNPKLGISYAKNGWNAFASYAVGQKEPNRDDFEAGATSQPNREQLHDVELGLEKKGRNFAVAANLFYMLYKDQLVLTGKINDVGAYTRVNVPNSYRAGIELTASVRPVGWLNLSGNLSLSDNRIKNFTEYIDDYDNGGQLTVQHQNTQIAFSPTVIGGFTGDVSLWKHTRLALISKYVGRQYLDNTSNKERSLDAFFVQDARLTVNIPNKIFSGVEVIFQVNNIFNRMYEPNGYTFTYQSQNRLTTENYYFPMAGTNVMAAVNITL